LTNYIWFCIVGVINPQGAQPLISFMDKISRIKKWAMEKIDRDYRKKIFFPFAKKLVVKRYDALRELLGLK
jgi:hypothetical protein